MSGHQHLVSLINFKAVWQPLCTINSGLLIAGDIHHVHCIKVEHMLCYSQIHPVSVREVYLQE